MFPPSALNRAKENSLLYDQRPWHRNEHRDHGKPADGVGLARVALSARGSSGHVLAEPTGVRCSEALALLTGHVATLLGSLRTPARPGRAH